MATETRVTDAVELGTGVKHWTTGGVAGFLGGALFGGMMAHTPMMENVAALLGLADPAAGWIIHLVISIIFGVVYAGIVSIDQLAAFARRPSSGSVLGAIYGVVVWIVGATIIMPFWLMGTFVIDPNWMSFVGHILYGGFLGVLYPILLTHE